LYPVLGDFLQPQQRIRQDVTRRKMHVGGPGEHGHDVVQQQGSAVVHRQPVEHRLARTQLELAARTGGELGKGSMGQSRRLGCARTAGRQHQYGHVVLVRLVQLLCRRVLGKIVEARYLVAGQLSGIRSVGQNER
jgi:hypothetical protein